jgi:hypothetical protein
MTGKRNGFPLNRTILEAYPWPQSMLGPIMQSMCAPPPLCFVLRVSFSDSPLSLCVASCGSLLQVGSLARLRGA